MTLKETAQKAMRDAKRHELDEVQLWHWLNNPAFQVGAMEKFIAGRMK